MKEAQLTGKCYLSNSTNIYPAEQHKCIYIKREKQADTNTTSFVI